MECPHLEDNACITTPNIKSENLPSRFVCGGEYSSYKVDECLDVFATKYYGVTKVNGRIRSKADNSSMQISTLRPMTMNE